MAYLCYFYPPAGGVPHFEVLPEQILDEAIERAQALLAQRPNAQRAELWEDDVLVLTVASPSSCQAAAG